MGQKTSVSSVTQIKSKIKVVFLGEQSTGKTSILMRFMHDKFQQGLGATVGIDFMAKNLSVGSHMLRLQLWDTAGQQRFRSLIPSYLKDAMITFIVFDICNLKSFQNLTQWFDLCLHNRKEKNIIILLGNKCDINQREISIQQANRKALQYNIKYFQVSAKTGQNIKEAFNYGGSQYVALNIQQNQMTFSKILNPKNFITQKQMQSENNNITIKKKQMLNQKKQNNNIKKGCC